MLIFRSDYDVEESFVFLEIVMRDIFLLFFSEIVFSCISEG